MILSRFKNKQHQQYLLQLAKIHQSSSGILTLYNTPSFRNFFLKTITTATKYIYITVLYFENDDIGQEVLNTLYKAKQIKPKLDIKIMVDLHRAKRNRIGTKNSITNAMWYYQESMKHQNINIPILGIPVNTRETLGVFHLKGFILDNIVIYSGASINNIYFQKYKHYRYDRYHILYNQQLALTMKSYIDQFFLSSPAIQKLNEINLNNINQNNKFKKTIKQFRNNLKKNIYQFKNTATNQELAVIPLIGLGKKNILNKTIIHLMNSTEKKMILCTPYFNLPSIVVRIINKLLKKGKSIEIIIGDKTASDFYLTQKEMFRIINIIPYLYEMNLRKFIQNLQNFIDNQQLIIRLWKNGQNSYHVKGIWIDNCWQFITGHNLNIRAWWLDLENAILIHDPQNILEKQKNQELKHIKTYTQIIKNYQEIENIKYYPPKIKKYLRRLHSIRFDRLIRHIM